MMASSTSMSVWYTNCSGSRQSRTRHLRCCRTSLFKVFMTCETRATGLKSFRALGHPFFSTRTIQDVLWTVDTFFSLKERPKRCMNTPATCSSQTLSTLRLMPSSPLALLVLVLVLASFHLMCLFLIVGVVVVVVGG